MDLELILNRDKEVYLTSEIFGIKSSSLKYPYLYHSMEDLMRKKSHIALAKYLVNSMDIKELVVHKKAFYIGSILPDCIPSFITRRHTIDKTFDILREEIRKITEDYNISEGINTYYCRHLGVITHYVADYFTFPHNSKFTGSVKEHCTYENELKFALKDYVKSEEAVRNRAVNMKYKTVDDICKFILEMHKEYLKVKNHIMSDCEYIVELCHKVVDAILAFFEVELAKVQSKPSAIIA